MIVITGAAGFIGSNVLSKLNYEGYRDIVLVDDFSDEGKYPNFKGKAYSRTVDRNHLFRWIDDNHLFVQFVIHLGAHSATDDHTLNRTYSETLWLRCIEYGLPLIYASSAATYGNPTSGFCDAHDQIASLQPQNAFGHMKHGFDQWALSQKRQPYFWAGLKLFTVYGPNEYHKGELASVVYRAYHQIRESGHIKLYRSSVAGVAHGEQSRDFVYVKDVAEVIVFLMELRKHSGFYNLGTAIARSFNEVARVVYHELGIPPNIVYGALPDYLRDGYQTHTHADLTKLRSIGFNHQFTSIEAGIRDYIQHYLFLGKYN